MKTVLSMPLLLFSFLFFSCGEDQMLPQEVTGDIVITISGLPAATEVGTSEEFTLQATQINNLENIRLLIDTVGQFELLIEGNPYDSVTMIEADKEYNLKITPFNTDWCKMNFKLATTTKVATMEVATKGRQTIPD